MPLDPLSAVRLVTDRDRDKGVGAGAVGVVLDVYEDAYEVEFSRADGSTVAWFAVEHDQVEPYAGSDAPSWTRTAG